ncbi:MAG: UbiA family prenyltransferase [Planctomycetes bacterium]|nr:UbiA family prenyltransferase [Planctomycetota bacterium]
MTVLRTPPTLFGRAAVHLENIKFSHSVFALPFAFAGAALAAREIDGSRWLPDLRTCLLVAAAAVAARTCAMSTNRVADRSIDAANPRTAARPIPSGALSIKSTAALAVASGLAFVLISFGISPLCGYLSPLVLAVLLGYSWTKRFTVWAHGVLGLALGLAPAGAWLAVTGTFEGRIQVPILLGAAVILWVAGFDLIYACQDAEFDRRSGLHSIPGRFGIASALRLSTALHIGAAALFIALGWIVPLGPIYYAAVGVIGLLLVAQHRIVRPDDLSRVNAAFFTLNGWVGIGFLAGLLSDLAWRTP